MDTGMKKVRNTPCRFDFCKFFTLWRQQFPKPEGDKENSARESDIAKIIKSGGSDPTFSAFSRPKSSWGRSRPTRCSRAQGLAHTGWDKQSVMQAAINLENKKEQEAWHF
jgi:hypothetical protein